MVGRGRHIVGRPVHLVSYLAEYMDKKNFVERTMSPLTQVIDFEVKLVPRNKCGGSFRPRRDNVFLKITSIYPPLG